MEEDFQLCDIDEIQKMLDKEEDERFGNTNTNISFPPEFEQSNMDGTSGSKEKKNVDYSMGAYFATRSSYPFANLNDMVTLLEDPNKYPNDLPERDEKLPGVEIGRQQDTIQEFDEKINSIYSNSDVSNLFVNKTNEGNDKNKRSSSYSIQSSQRRGYSLGSWADSTVEDGIEGVLQPIHNNNHNNSTNITQSMEDNNGSINSLVQFFQDPDKTPLSSKEIMEHVLQYCKTRSTTGMSSSNSKYKHINSNKNNETINSNISNGSSSITKKIDKSSTSTSKENRLIPHRKSADSYLMNDNEPSQRLDSFDWSNYTNDAKQCYSISSSISSSKRNSTEKPSFLFDNNYQVIKKKENKKESAKSIAYNNDTIPRDSMEYKAFSDVLNQSKKKSSRSSTPDSGISRNDDDYRKSSIGSLFPTTTTNAATNNGGRNDSGCDNSQFYRTKKSSSIIAATSSTTAAAFQQKQQHHHHVIESQNNGSDYKNYVSMSSSMSMISKTVNIGSRHGRKPTEKTIITTNNTPILKQQECKQQQPTTTSTFPIIVPNNPEKRQQQQPSPTPSTVFNQERQVMSSVPISNQQEQPLTQQQQPINVQFNFPMPPLPSSAVDSSSSSSSSVNVPPIVINIAYPPVPCTSSNNNGQNDGQPRPRMSLQFSGSIQYH